MVHKWIRLTIVDLGDSIARVGVDLYLPTVLVVFRRKAFEREPIVSLALAISFRPWFEICHGWIVLEEHPSGLVYCSSRLLLRSFDRSRKHAVGKCGR